MKMRGTITFESERKRRGAVLRVMCLSLMMVVASVASLNVALPELARDTGATQTQLQWIVDAYALAFAALLLPAGAIGDRFGRKPILAIGLALFGLASLAAMFVSTPEALIGLRVAMGVGAAFVMPVTLSVITTIFPPEERGKAVGTWVGVAAGGARDRPARLGRPARVAVLAGDLRPQRRARDDRARRHDRDRPEDPRVAPAAARPGRNADLRRRARSARLRDHRRRRARLRRRPVLAALVAAVGGIVMFVLWELRRREPMLDPRNFLRRGFGAGSLSVTVQFFAMFGFLFLALPYLQLVMGFSPLQAAAALLPMALVVIPLSRVAPAIAGRVGVRVTGATGLSLMATGFLVLSQLEVGLVLLGLPRRPAPVRRGHGALRRAGHDRDRRLAPA